jgi:hypothetical protein
MNAEPKKSTRSVPVCECGAEEGAFHEGECRWELCPFCARTDAGGCDCAYDHLLLRRRSNPAACQYLSEDVYKQGPTDAQSEEWRERCAVRGRLPYVYAPSVCARCGVLWPEMFIVQDAAWEYYAGPLLRECLLCEACFATLRRNIDAHQPRPSWVPSEDETNEYLRAWRARDQETLKRLDPDKFKPGRRNLRFP